MHPQYERLSIGGGTLVGFLPVWTICADSDAVDPLLISSPSRTAQAGAGVALVEEIHHIQRRVEAWRSAVAP